MGEIAAAVLFRLERESTVPVIVSLLPVLHQLFRTDRGIQMYLTEAKSRPVLNWILLGIARDIQSDPESPSSVALADKVVAAFLALSRRPVGARRVRMEHLRASANMTVAHTRNSDPDHPTYRIPQNRDPDAILSAHYGNNLDCLTYAVPESVALFQQAMRKMLLDLSRKVSHSYHSVHVYRTKLFNLR